MGRKKSVTKRMENTASRQVMYTKRRGGLLRKASELSILCDTDVALVMFSPTGEPTTFASNGRFEDVFVRYLERHDALGGGPNPSEKALSGRLKQLKNEAQMLEKIAIIEDLEARLTQLNNRKREVQERLRIYNANVEQLNKAFESDLHQRFLINAIQHMQQAKLQAILLNNETVPQSSQDATEADAVNMDDVTLTNEQHVDLNHNSNSAGSENLSGPSLPIEPLHNELAPNSEGY